MTTPQQPTPQPSVTNGQDTPPDAFAGFVVAIGASAGGLEALERFFTHCPSDSGSAFVVIQHLSPDHKSIMHDLLGRYTDMQVKMVEDGGAIQENTVYLIPPGTIMRIADSCFQLSPKSPHLLTLPIDIFLTALADDVGSRSIGVILSGTGSDGTRGAVAVNAAGGLLLAQEPRDAKFDGMPNSVVATGLVDAILPADKLAARVMAHVHSTPLDDHELEHPDFPRIPLSQDDALEGIVQLLLQASGIDFHDYKTATIIRRIERRLQVRQMRSMDDYFQLLERDRNELSTLRRELLIPVTSFFRDGDAFEVLCRKAIEPLVSEAKTGETLRVWVAGTSTGEEAYSIAILFLEAFDREKRWPNLKVFATDVNQQNVEFAAMGHYPESAAAELTQERLDRYFTRVSGRYAVKPELRQTIVFARHNLLSDPPFTRMGLVSCRNTLIYFTPEAQKKALYRLQYAVRPGGFLFLGSSESLGGQTTGFVGLHNKHKLYHRFSSGGPIHFSTAGTVTTAPTTPLTNLNPRQPASRIGSSFEDSASVDEATQALLDEYSPPSMLVNKRLQVVHLFGRVQPYFCARQGSASLEISRILPDALVPVASALLFKALKEHQRMVSDFLPVTLDSGEERQIRLNVRPLQPRGDEQLCVLSFQERPTESGTTTELVPVNVDAEAQARIEVLQRELAATRESLQATIEELETSNEELQATNEELMASNEELQSSNEELQSVNEELNTVNAEYQEKVSILNHLNADLDSMSKAVGVATVFVDEALNLTRFSPDAVSIFKLREGDVGRPLDEIRHVLKYPELIEDIRHTLRSERMVEKEALSVDGRLFLIRILPYGVPSSSSRGAVATFVDISAFRDRDQLQAIIDGLPEHIAVLEVDGRIALVNEAWRRFASANGDPDLKRSGIGSNYLEACQIVDTQDDSTSSKRARLGVKGVLEGSLPLFSMEYPCHSPNEQRWFIMNVAPIHGHAFGAVVSHINISAWHEREADSG